MPSTFKTKFILAAAFLATVICLAPVSRAAIISGLFNTGVDPSAALLLTGQPDPHYSLILPASSTAVAVDDSAGSIITPLGSPWAQNSATSRWIGPSVSSSGAGGNYDYRTTFSLPANAVLSTVNISGSWAVDDIIADVLINGNSTAPITPFYTPLTPFTLPTGFYQTGINTLDFLVGNANIGQNPTGLRIEGIKGVYRVVPEPGTASMAIAGLFICSALAHRQRSQPLAEAPMI
ncbi:MAG TPA: hypothetical protein VGM76_08640 [Lacipirellulaceae bacterium]|jgi:hypothetical protein